MSSVLLNTIESIRSGKNMHTVGSLNNWDKTMINQGAKVAGGNIDNFNIVELGFNKEGERTCKLLSDIKKKGYLIASVEDYIGEFEGMSQFFNAEGEMARIVVPTLGMRFECSNVEGTNIQNGQVAYFDPEKTKFVVVASGKESSDPKFETAANKFVVVDANAEILDGQQTVRFELV